jgi:uncharacterized protein YecE (DUF72 family)
MKFGHLETSELDQLDLSLPEDHKDTTLFLGNLSNDQQTHVHIGCAKWNIKEWVGLIYPEKTKSADFLTEYVKLFNSVELNTTFYSWKRDTVDQWLSKTEGEFTFCPKFSRTISHFKRLKNVEDLTDYYLANCLRLGQHMGCAFLQMPDNFTPKKFEDLRSYLESIPNDFPLCVELRHTDWFNDLTVADEVFDLLRSCNKSMVITDTAGRRDVIHQRITSDTVFIRFNGYDLHSTDYKRMDEWVEKIKSWMEKGIKNVYFFPHQANEKFTPVCCAYMTRELNNKCGLNLKLDPVLLNLLG